VAKADVDVCGAIPQRPTPERFAERNRLLTNALNPAVAVACDNRQSIRLLAWLASRFSSNDESWIPARAG